MDCPKVGNFLEVVIHSYHFQRYLITGFFLKHYMIWYNHQKANESHIQFSGEIFLLQEQVKQWMN